MSVCVGDGHTKQIGIALRVVGLYNVSSSNSSSKASSSNSSSSSRKAAKILEEKENTLLWEDF